MESVYNIHPLDIKLKNIKLHYNYDFIKNEYNNVYYSIVNSYNLDGLFNLYRFLYLRSLKINHKVKSFRILPLIKSDENINQDEFNSIIKNYINKDDVYEIFIINSIQCYFI